MADEFVARLPSGERVVLRVKGDINKLADLDPSERLQALLKMFPRPKRDDQNFRSIATGALYPRGSRSFLEVLQDLGDDADDDADRDDDGNGDDDEIEKADHRASVVADLLTEAGSFPDRATALHYLLRKPGGQALLARMSKGKETFMTSIEPLESVAKSRGVPGVVEIAKNIDEEQRSFRITETEFVKLIDIAARVTHPELGARAFEKVYERNPVLAKAIAVIKAELFTQAGGAPAPASHDLQHAKSDRGLSSAYDELMLKAEAYRDVHPELSISQAFEKVFTAPANRELANRERVESAA